MSLRWPGKNSSDQFRSLQKFKILTFFLLIVLWCKRKIFLNLKKNLIVKVSLIFWKCRFLGTELLKIYMIGRNVTNFENRKKLLNHSTLSQTQAMQSQPTSSKKILLPNPSQTRAMLPCSTIHQTKQEPCSTFHKTKLE